MRFLPCRRKSDAHHGPLDSPQFFDPIRAFFVRAHVEGIWHIEGYPLIKWLRSKVSSTGFSFALSSKAAGSGDTPVEGDAVGKDAWKDRVEAEKTVIGWLDEFPGGYSAAGAVGAC